MMNKRILLFISVPLLLSSIISCNKKLDVDSTRLASEKNEWKKMEDAKALLLGVYGLTRGAISDENRHWLYGEFRNGDFTAVSRPDLKAIINGQLNANYPVLNAITNWRGFYAAINAASLFIERSGEIVSLDLRYTEINNKVDIAQARVLRAFTYFYMTRIWGDIPLNISSKEANFDQLPCSSQEVVLAFCESELLKALGDLPYMYGRENDDVLPGPYYGGSPESWAGKVMTKGSAYALLAHIAALQKRYSDCDIYVKAIQDASGKLNISKTSIKTLVDRFGLFYYAVYSDLTTRCNQMIAFHSYSTQKGHFDNFSLAAPYAARQTPDVYITADTINAMFKDHKSDNVYDIRQKDLRFGYDPVDGSSKGGYFANYFGQIPLFIKYNTQVDGTTNPIYGSCILFTRPEELFLLRAEALCYSGQIAQSLDELNACRANRGLDAFKVDLSSSITQQKALLWDAIFAERRRELAGEGWHWYDYVRKMRVKDPTFEDKMIKTKIIYWPVSADIRALNPKIPKHPYWNK